MFPLQTFAPDLNPLTPGICLDMDGAYPSEGGGLAPVPGVTEMSAALASKCLGCLSFRDMDANFRTIAGTSAKLYELQADLTFLDVSKAGDYTTSEYWRFAAWGNWLIATNYAENVQVQKIQSNDFADLTGAARAKYVTASNNFLILANVYDGAAYGNRLQWCAQGDAEDWTPSSTTQAGYYDLTDTSGDITGLAKLGEYIVVFKETAIYLGSYIGPPAVWSFRRIGSFFGTLSNEAVVETEIGLFYPSNDDFYLFDGNYPQRIGSGVRKWFLDSVDRTFIKSVIGSYDGVRRLLFWHFPTNADNTGSCVDCLIYDLKNQRWGRKQMTVEASLVHWQPIITYDTIAEFWATYDAIASPLTYNSPIWSETSFSIAIFGSDHKLKRLNGAPDATTLKSHYQGNPMAIMEVYGVWPYFGTEPDTCIIYPLVRNTLGSTASTGTASTVVNEKADMITAGRYFGLELTLTGEFELFGVDVLGKEIAKN